MSILFRDFIEQTFDGNQAKAATELGVSTSLVSRILSGDRNVTPAIAARIEELSDGRFSKEKFIWPEAA